MKRFVITVAALLLVLFGLDAAYYRLGWYINFRGEPTEVTSFTSTDEDTIYVDRGDGPQPFIIKGVNLGAGIPGHFATDYAIDKETYLRWFRQIQEMGANTIRVYTILQDDFYNAFYEYNKDNPEPLYLLHGVWVNDYVQNSHRDAYDADFLDAFLRDSRTVVDILHGKKKLNLGVETASGIYRKDVSPWVLGYILGVEWENVTVTYTDHKFPDMEPFQGKYLRATADASAFESMLTQVGDNIIAYETERYGQQRLVAFSNWQTTDPFQYPADITWFFGKCAVVDVEHIQATDAFLSGQFASYHVYPYYSDYLNYILRKVENTITPEEAERVMSLTEGGVSCMEYLEGTDEAAFLDSRGRVNTYLTYLKMLTKHHKMPVVISEFGVSTGRGMAQRDYNTNRNQGHMSETEQGQALVECWEDIMAAGCNGGCVFTWQDEWFKRTWNTMHAVDLQRTPFWSDYQTNEQYFGLLSFDPGKEASVCYVDGKIDEWRSEDLVLQEGDLALSVKYDERFLYFLIRKEGDGPFYLPIDTTQKSGSKTCQGKNLTFDREADFLLVLDGKENSRLLVQERYEVLRAMFYHEAYAEDAYIDPPAKDTPVFKPVELLLQTATPLLSGEWAATAETYETGLLTYGNANPKVANYNSLADFMFSTDGQYIEVKLPWQLLNFADPSSMNIHDDYYAHYGVEKQTIKECYIGLGDGSETISMEAVPLKGWKNKVTYHERLKPSYYRLQKLWTAAE